MIEHLVFPKSEDERQVLLRRLSDLEARVMSFQEWAKVLASARNLIPKVKATVAVPSEIDLKVYEGLLHGQVLRVTLNAFAAQGTYESNRRYSLDNWTHLARYFYIMAPYLVPPRTLEFAVDILRAARDKSNDTFIQAISLFVRNEPLVVRQVVNSHDLDRLRNDLNERLARCCELGEECALAADDGELTQDEYDDWYYRADESVSLAGDFFGSFAYTLPICFQRLKDLTIEINRPPDDDEEPDSTYERESPREQEFWTIERIFEDL